VRVLPLRTGRISARWKLAELGSSVGRFGRAHSLELRDFM
jgi:hypothetical protein